MPTKTLQILNLIGFILVITLNALANALPINGMTTGELSDLYPNLFVPAGFTFSIWGVIYLLLLAFTIYQARSLWSKTADDQIVQIVGIWFFVSCLANASWIVVWHYQQVLLSFFIMLVILTSLIMIYRRLNTGTKTINRSTKYLAHLPFSVYLGWITVATIANVTTLLVNYGLSGFLLGETIWTAIMITIAVAMGIYFLWKQKDVPYALVIIWALYGITAVRFNNVILLTAYIGIGLLAIGAVLRIKSWLV